MEFHKAQLEAIRHFNGPCITLAGPGSGKTTVLTYRILNLIEKCGVAPEHILVITFTRAAATEMKERFLKLSDNRYSGVCFQTFHSFFFMILRKAYGYRADNIITQQEQTRFFKNILNEYELEITDTMELIRHATAWISNVKRSGKSPDTQPVAAAGICPQEIFCCLTMTVSAEQSACRQTLNALHRVKTELGCKTCLGVSNISFGLPNRDLVTRTFLTMALEEGLDLPIINPNIESITGAVRAYRVLDGIDKNSMDFIAAYNDAVQAPAANNNVSTDMDIMTAVFNGFKSEGALLTEKMLAETGDAMKIVNEMLIPALDKVGEGFEKNKIFLPQLIQSANAAQACFDVIKKHISKTSGETVSKGKIIVATVKGDIHDIGKNIVKVLLDNYGYTVVDLGKDVDPQLVVDTAIEQNIKMIGLSALMTTTLKSMEDTIKLVRETKELQNPDGSSKCVIFVGGAVLTEEYAMKIGADYYCRDAKESVDTAKKVLG